MARLFPSLVSRLILLSFLAVLACTAPALADTYANWAVNVTLAGGGSVTGEFTIDREVLETAILQGGGDYAITNFDITATVPSGLPGGAVNPFTFLPMVVEGSYAGFSATLQGEPTTPVTTEVGFIVLLGPSSAWTWEYAVQLTYDGLPGDLLTATEIPLVTGSATYYDVISLTGGDPTFYAAGGTIDPVPLPPSAFLLGSGLIALAWARRKQRLRK
ncbi:MAG: hypothetical protein ACLPYB_04005 [Desulfobaccales bacterium]